MDNVGELPNEDGADEQSTDKSRDDDLKFRGGETEECLGQRISGTADRQQIPGRYISV